MAREPRHSLAALMALVSSLTWLVACRPKPADLLTVADVQRVTGRSDIQAATRVEEGTEALRFAGADQVVVLTVSVQARTELDRLRAKPMYFRGPVDGIGDGAFEGPRFGFPMYLYFRKGHVTVALLTYADPANREDAPLISRDQLVALGRIAASRM